MNHTAPLCQPYDPFRVHANIYSKLFLPGKFHVALRPFHIARDLPLVNQWLNFQFAHLKAPIPDPFRYTEDYYATLLDTSNSQPLLGMIEEKPAFEADLYHAMLGPDSLFESMSITENDYILQLMPAPETMLNLSLSMYSLLACLDCFFTYNEINRIIWLTSAAEKNARFIASMAELDEIHTEDGLQSFHSISKERFRTIQHTLPFYPARQPVAIDY